MRKSVRIAGVAAVALAVGTGAVAGPASGEASPKAASATWTVAQTNTLPGEDGIKAITVAPTTSTWAVGYQTMNGKRVPLVQYLLSSK
jgi:hypothetical protein